MNASNDEMCAEADIARRRRVTEVLIRKGVQIIDPDRTYIDDQVQVAAGAVLYPGTHLCGETSIGTGSRIGPDCWIEDSLIEERCIIRYSTLEKARVRGQTTVGPYAHLRAGADVGPEARIGNYVEIKESRLGRGVKAGHLSYIGDADVGEFANIGAGTITCNYDGTAKHRTVIGPHAFIGSNSSLVAPLTIGDHAIVAAGSTITQDVPSASLAFGRARQVNKESGRRVEEDEPDDQ
jgi:bifunctional UDP-N-acetylglucosamine pyrophosphorylase / glucosamine-1-phosphate N-acetyltransferase